MDTFEERIRDVAGEGLYSVGLDILQVNIGLRCNQECRHCHVQARPGRAEMMDWATMALVARAARRARCDLVDLTGGAPELHPHFRRFVETLCHDGARVQLRTNLTALLEPGLQTLPSFLRDNGVHLVGSLPCYLEQNVRGQRGDGVYQKSIEAIRRLNDVGYGTAPDLPLNLVYNPGGAFLPPPQPELEDDYRRELQRRFDVAFSRLLTITNMPIGRFQAELREQGREHDYAALLHQSFNAETVPGLMCRHQISVGWDGSLHDCDFNLALGWPVGYGAPDSIARFDATALARRRIVTGDHCFGCTAGSGSSCAGALV